MALKHIKISLVGKSGRMGNAIIEEIEKDPALSHELEVGRADLIIDFSNPSELENTIKKATGNAVPLVVGTTGLNDKNYQALRDASKSIPVLQSNNLSEGMAHFKALVCRTQSRLGPDYKIEIIETHHIHKIDAPSGTAIMLRDALKNPQNIKMTSHRVGEVFGDHTVQFTSNDDIIELTHKAENRQIFAKGALKAGIWLLKQKPDFYTIDDMVTCP